MCSVNLLLYAFFISALDWDKFSDTPFDCFTLCVMAHNIKLVGELVRFRAGLEALENVKPPTPARNQTTIPLISSL
jgi:hypothetical protein